MSANIASVDEESLKSDLRELVRKTVQETLNALLDEEADEMVGAGRHERTAAREAYRSGHHKRKPVTAGGEVVLGVPKLRGAALLRLRGRGLSGVRLVAGDKSPGTLGALEEVFPEARYRRRTVRFYRNVFGKVPRRKRTRAAKMLKANHAQESREASEAKASEAADPLESMKPFAAAEVVREGLRRDARLRRLPHAALDQDQDEQRHRAAEQGDPPPNPRRRHVPRREIRADAGDRQAEIHSRKRAGPQALPGRIAARREGGRDVGR